MSMRVKFVPSIYDSSVELRKVNACEGWIDKARILTNKEFIEYIKSVSPH